MPVVKRIDMIKKTHNDERGWVANPLEVAGIPSEILSSLHIASIQPGCVRGNHYHTHATEWLLTFGGNAKFYWRLMDKEAIHEEVISGADPVLFEIPPNVAHAILNDSEAEIFIMAFRNAPDPDTIQSLFVKG